MRNKIFGALGFIISLFLLANAWLTSRLSETSFSEPYQIENLVIGVILLIVSIFILLKKSKETKEPKEKNNKIFSQQFAFLASILCIVFGMVGATISPLFFSKVFLIGIILLVVLIIWKFFLIFKGKEKWGIY